MCFISFYALFYFNTIVLHFYSKFHGKVAVTPFCAFPEMRGYLICVIYFLFKFFSSRLISSYYNWFNVSLDAILKISSAI